MTDFMNSLRTVASNSTVRRTAAVLAVGGFVANAFFGFGQTAVGLGIQVVGAAVTLGVVAAKTCQNKFEQTDIAQPNDPVIDTPEDTQSLIQDIISCGPTFTPSLPTRKKRRNADNDMMDMAYGTGISSGWKPWAK